MIFQRVVRGVALGVAILGTTAGSLYVADNVVVPWTGLARTFLVNPPATRGVARSSDRPWTYTINSDGLRGPEVPRRKRPGTTRLMVLGDSMTFGYGVGDAETYPKVLEALLNAGKTSGAFEVINVSRSGVGPWEYLLYLKTFGPRYHPDVVLIGLYLGKDIIQATNPYEATSGHWPTFRTVLRESLPHTYALLEHIYRRMRARGEYLDSGRLTDAEFIGYLDGWARRDGVSEEMARSRLRRVDAETWRLVLQGEINPSLLIKAVLHPTLMRDVMLMDTPETARAWEAAQRVLRELFQRSQQLGARPVMILIPEGVQVSEKVADLYQRLGFIVDPVAVQSRRPQGLVTDFARGQGVPVIDLAGAFLKPASQDVYLPLDIHWNAEGNRIAAEAIAEALIRQGVIAGSPRAAAGARIRWDEG